MDGVIAQTNEARWLYRIGGVSAICGAVIGLVGNLAHPGTPAPGEPETARVIAESAIWIPLHFALIIGFLLMRGGLVAIQYRSRVRWPARWGGWQSCSRRSEPPSASSFSRPTASRRGTWPKRG